LRQPFARDAQDASRQLASRLRILDSFEGEEQSLPVLPPRRQFQFPDAILRLPGEARARLEEAGEISERLDGDIAFQAVTTSDDGDGDERGGRLFLVSRCDSPAAARWSSRNL
jgi:hypothetical protein